MSVYTLTIYGTPAKKEEEMKAEKGDKVLVEFEGEYSHQGAKEGFHVVQVDGKNAHAPKDATVTVVKKAKKLPPEPGRGAVVQLPDGELCGRGVFSGMWYRGAVSGESPRYTWEDIAGSYEESEIQVLMGDPIKGWRDLEEAEFFPVERYSDGTRDMIRAVRKKLSGGVDGVAVGSAVFSKEYARRLARRILAEVGW